ncbi:MAG: UDP-N-acetylmuramoyl-tripeptide--D-alanyl-D-alanine ligase [Spirochaetaceae bacterium]|nr:UDP-N-acetylmuramoyl-tripeptide--D-alanyl-D-alanine ligase [Spirochaetaceae bacterium]
METETLLSFENLIDAVEDKLIGKKSSCFGFSSVAIDSRECAERSLFVPLIGTVQDGHIYIEQALQNGASVVFVANSELPENEAKFVSLAEKFDATFIAVSNTMTALQKAAKRYVEQFPSLIKIGVTGSSGKTTTKEIIASVLSQKYVVVTNEGNLNSETGLPLSVFKIRKEHEVGIFEMGMNRRGEISEIASVLFPSIAVITNIGTAHIGILGTQDAIAEEKKKIFSNFSDNCIGFVPENDKYAAFLQKVPKGRIEKYGIKSNRRIRDVSSSGLDGTTFEYDGVFIRFPVPGKHNFSNALAAISVAEYLHLSTGEIKKGLESVKTIFGRSQIYRGDKTLVHDCYNANPDSMESAISFCDDLEWKGKKIYVLGDMLELGEKSKELHSELGRKAAKSKADYVLFFGNEMENAYKACKDKKRSFWSNNIADISEELETSVCNGDLVLLKASKGMELWRAADALNIKLGGHA